MALNSEIIIVSGLPRSGTSLMMQMLHQGGILALTDAIRTADVDNPRGYFELERVKKLKEDSHWIAEARGQVVKMISSLLYDLPPTERYRIIFMRRDLDEVIESQEKMLARRNQPLPSRDSMKTAFAIHLKRLFQWLQQQPGMRILECNYNDLLATPDREVQRIATFLDDVPDVSRMLEAIDPSLYRNRHAATSDARS